MTNDAVALIDEVVARPTLDEYLDRDPKELTDDDLKQLIEVLRADRVRFTQAEVKKKAKAEGVVLDDDELEDAA